MKTNAFWYKRGLRDGMPICIGYFAVAFALGITAKNAGLTAFQAALTAMLTNASAGGYAGFTLMAASATYAEMAVMQLVANARYLLMSCALSQKLDAKTPLLHRLIIGFDITDEIFGISVAVDGKLNPFYTFGAMTVSIPGWAAGTYLGVVVGNVLPVSVVSALSVGLYGMFLAIIIPPARRDKVVAVLIAISFAASFLVSRVQIFAVIPEGVRIIALTVIISLAAAILFPKGEEENAG